MLKKTGSSADYLNKNNLEESTIIDRICFVDNMSAGVAKNTQGFYTFFVKDINNTVIPARMFNIREFIAKGNVAVQLKKKFVRIKGMVQYFGGSISIVLDSIEVYDGAVDRELFLGKIKDVGVYTEDAQAILSTLGEKYNVDKSLELLGLGAMYSGKIGGPMKYLATLLQTVVVNYYENVKEKELLAITYMSFKKYITYLKVIEDKGTMSVTEKITVLKTINFKDERLSRIATDTVSAVLGLSSPEHLYAHLIKRAYEEIDYKEMLISSWELIPEGHTRKIGDEVLIKY